MPVPKPATKARKKATVSERKTSSPTPNWTYSDHPDKPDPSTIASVQNA